MIRNFLGLAIVSLIIIGCDGKSGGKDADAEQDTIVDTSDDAKDITNDEVDEADVTEALGDHPADSPWEDTITDFLQEEIENEPDVMEEDVEPAEDGGSESDSIDPREEACLDAGGIIETILCCLSSGDYPDLCSVGTCGCSPDHSHDVIACICPTGECFNGSNCVPLP